MPYIIAVDGDGVLCDGEWPAVGSIDVEMVDALQACQDAGAVIILWTCRRNAALDVLIERVEKPGFAFDAVNANLPAVMEYYGRDGRKLAANLYLDDHAFGWDRDGALKHLHETAELLAIFG